MIPVAMMLPGPMELGVIFVIVLMLFGAGKLPQVFGEMGKGLRTLRDATRDDDTPLLRDDETYP